MSKTVYKVDGKYVIGFTYTNGKMVPWTTDNVKEIPKNQINGPMMEGMLKQVMDSGQVLDKEDIEVW